VVSPYAAVDDANVTPPYYTAKNQRLGPVVNYTTAGSLGTYEGEATTIGTISIKFQLFTYYIPPIVGAVVVVA
jgi:hypothetical protein